MAYDKTRTPTPETQILDDYGSADPLDWDKMSYPQQQEALANHYGIPLAVLEMRDDCSFNRESRQRQIEILRENPVAQINQLIRPLVDQLQKALDYEPHDDDTETLGKQAQALDLTFRRFLAETNITYKNSDKVEANLMNFAAAMKAQEQFQFTVNLRQKLKKGERRNDRTGKET